MIANTARVGSAAVYTVILPGYLYSLITIIRSLKENKQQGDVLSKKGFSLSHICDQNGF